MTNSLRGSRAYGVLEKLHEAASHDRARPSTHDVDLATATSEQRAEYYAESYLAVSPEGGELLYSLVRAARPATVVEFGTSFGVSTIYLAAAVAANGSGHVHGTELSPTKAASATASLAEAGLAGWASVHEGDALEFLEEQTGPVDFVLLDGWKNLYLPVLDLLLPRLSTGALVVADNASFPAVRPYLDRVRHPAGGFTSANFPAGDGMEVSCWTPA